MQGLDFHEHEIGVAMQLACVVLNLLALEHSSANAEVGHEDVTSASATVESETIESEPAQREELCRSMIGALGVEIEGDETFNYYSSNCNGGKTREGQLTEALRRLMSATPACADAALSAGDYRVKLARECVCVRESPQVTRIKWLA